MSAEALDSDLMADRFMQVAKDCGIPSHMIGGIYRYVAHRIEPGSFLMAVMENDFMEALARADEINVNCLKAYGMFIYNYVPSACHGSPEKVAAWLRDPA